jgi:perosamine synthetase
MSLSLSSPDITDLEIEAVVSVLKSNRLSLGPWMDAFEHHVAAWVDVPFGIAVSSGTAGLHLCLVALGIGLGDEVIVPSFTFIAAANAIRYVGATPVFVDVEAESLNLDPARVEDSITSRTRAIIAVHTFGRAARMQPLLDLSVRHGLRLIEDACEALGATCNGAQVGSFGDAAVFAFYPNKQITTGEGGMIVTRNSRLAEDLRALRNQGRYPSDGWHQHSVLGFNYRLSEMQCALGTSQMSRLPDILSNRRAVAERYTELLKNDPRIELPSPGTPGSLVSWFVYVVRLQLGRFVTSRDHVAEQMANAGVPTGRYFAPIHQQPAYNGCRVVKPLPVTEQESLRTLALPFSTRLGDEDVSRVVETLVQALQGVSD